MGVVNARGAVNAASDVYTDSGARDLHQFPRERTSINKVGANSRPVPNRSTGQPSRARRGGSWRHMRGLATAPVLVPVRAIAQDPLRRRT